MLNMQGCLFKEKGVYLVFCLEDQDWRLFKQLESGEANSTMESAVASPGPESVGLGWSFGSYGAWCHRGEPRTWGYRD